jgi:pyridoxine 4-dehydrogenase
MVNAAHSGRFRIGGAFDVNRLGFGAMRVVGRGIWGPPADRAEALKTLRRLPDLGVDFIDTADSYGPDFSEELIREALAPYGKIHVATKGGLARTGPNIWIPLGRPEYLIQQAHKSRWRLGVETISLWQLHRIDPKVAVRRDRLADQGQGHPVRWPVGSQRRGDRGGGEGLPGRHGAESL